MKASAVETSEVRASELAPVVKPLDVAGLRQEFPILSTLVHGKPLVYFDNAATTQKPREVLEAEDRFYRTTNANIHRGAHTLSQQATAEYELTRQKIARFINAAEAREIIFTRGTTESINLVATSFGRRFIAAGDEIIISAMEHHSNIVPWQMLCEQTGAVLRVIPMNDRGELQLDEYRKLLSDRTKLVAVVHVSNSLGTINPVKQIIAMAHERGAAVLIDGAQWVAHAATDVRDLDADFYAFSGHKIYGPTGIGVLYGKAKWLEQMPPYQGGGDMISSVSFVKTIYNVLPHKFEAGTPNIAGVIGLGAAIDFVSRVGLHAIAQHERDLLEYATHKMGEISGVRLIGTAENKAGAISFVVDEPPLSPLDVGSRLDEHGIAVRTGHHCCQPVMERLGIDSTARASFAMYNTREEIDVFAQALRGIVEAESGKAGRTPAAQGVTYAPAQAASPEAAGNELVETFELLGDWEQRNHFVVDLGDKLQTMPANLKTEENRVRGCMSTVHIAARKRPGSGDILEFVADSDAALVRGLIALLQRVYSGQPAKQVLEFDIQGLLKRLGLDQHLSMGRRNGLEGMINRIRAEAAKIAAA